MPVDVDVDLGSAVISYTGVSSSGTESAAEIDLAGVGLLRRRFELTGHGAGAQLAQVRDVVVEGARGDVEQFGNRGDGAAGSRSRSRAVRMISSVATVGRPTTRSRARVAAKPSLVRILIYTQNQPRCRLKCESVDIEGHHVSEARELRRARKEPWISPLTQFEPGWLLSCSGGEGYSLCRGRHFVGQ